MLRAVDDVLEEIGAGDRPRLLVLNKADAARRRAPRRARASAIPTAVLVSALTGEGLDALGERIDGAFERTLRRRRAAAALLARAAAWPSCTSVAGDLEREDTAEGVRVSVRLPAVVAERFARFAANGAG